MISAGEFRNGLTVEIDGIVYQIIDFSTLNPEKETFVRTKLKDIKNGGVTENISPYGEIPPAHIDRSEMQT